ncbi:uncharacterized protein BJ212DRAFT_1060396 [Suillus subaureus]|uniref:Postreplication repair E3 ubiquitin-protein ligase RAD18 n=1 Tax=Suillus subaureus TaxID=48587 RepID=A0A9P7JFP9_9AGAM|nr:uncharacterized protein BJ212DRAFT_1060396 [Suillus subaureus]KAG1819685.1 hypothetical protein BJ212DRAFT_1060396 [Suillus subaureus]
MPTNNVQALLSTNIPDPSDFPMPDLRQLDASMRCTICGELYDAPITLACGHCFCSLCIREHIVKESECPSCRKPTSEGQFRTNPVLEEAVSAWKTARSTILRLSREEQDRTRRSQEEQTPRRSKTPLTNGKKRKRRVSSMSSDSDVVIVPGPSNSSQLTSSPVPNKSRRLRRQDMEPSSDPQEEEIVQGGRMVNCPICNVSIVMGDINTHLDSGCQKFPSGAVASGTKDQWSKLFLKKGKSRDNGIDVDDATERIPKASYDVLKDKQVKDLLHTHNLPIIGDRKTWIARHQRWVMIFNANLDKSGSNRKTTKELRNELKNWEDSRKRRHLVDNTATHMLNNQGEFARLIAEARDSKARKDSSPTIVRQHPQDDNVVGDSEDDQSLSYSRAGRVTCNQFLLTLRFGYTMPFSIDPRSSGPLGFVGGRV